MQCMYNRHICHSMLNPLCHGSSMLARHVLGGGAEGVRRGRERGMGGFGCHDRGAEKGVLRKYLCPACNYAATIKLDTIVDVETTPSAFFLLLFCIIHNFLHFLWS